MSKKKSDLDTLLETITAGGKVAVFATTVEQMIDIESRLARLRIMCLSTRWLRHSMAISAFAYSSADFSCVLVAHPKSGVGWRCKMNAVVWLGEMPTYADKPAFADFENACGRGDKGTSFFNITEVQRDRVTY